MTFHVASDSLDWALAHLEKFGDSDIFPRTFEIHAIRHEWAAVRGHLASVDLDTRPARQHRICLSPKGRYSYRIATELDPLDALVYLALVYEAGTSLEQHRLPASDDVAIAYRFLPQADGTLYDRSYSWRKFLEVCERELTGSSHVVVADIADFFYRLYHHRVQNTLNVATNNGGQSRGIFKLINQWSGTPSYGIPVGPAASRLIAETTITDIDKHLRAEGGRFCRYVDDYRIFCTTYREAYERLSSLAQGLFESHGLTLQPDKTAILTVDTFRERFMFTHESEELGSLKEKYEALKELVWFDPYDIPYDQLAPDEQKVIDELNLESLLLEQIAKDEPDLTLMRFILRRLTALNDSDVAERVAASLRLPKLYALVADVMKYLAALTGVDDGRKQRVGAIIIGLLDDSIIAHLPYHRYWLLSLFAADGTWADAGKLIATHAGAGDQFTRREAILGIGRARQDFWFRIRKGSVTSMEPWERRAFLAASSCLPKDERDHWYASLRGRVDFLDQIVIDWARANPF